MIFLDSRQTAEAGTDEHADPLGILFIDDKTGILHGKMGGSHRVLDEEIHLLDLFFVDEILGIEIP